MSDRLRSAPAYALSILPATSLAVALAFAGTMISGAAMAQDAKPAAPAAAPAKPAEAAKPAADGKAAGGLAKGGAAEEAKTAWYKICADVNVPTKGKDGEPAVDKDGKTLKEKKNACTTFYESFNPATGAPLVYVAVEEGEGIEKKVLTVTVPHGLALPPGMAITVFQKEQWDKFVAENKEGKTVKPEDVGLKPIELKYLHCQINGCASVSELQAEFLEQMKTGVGIIVRAVELNNKVVDFPVSLKGFKEAYAGAAVDTKEFIAFRSERLKQMETKRGELMQQFRQMVSDKEKKDGAAKPAAPAEKAAAAPAEKK